MSSIPEVINRCNVYRNGNKMIGVSDEVQLAEFASITDTISGGGILGEIETVVVGQFSSMKQEIPFRILDDDIFALGNPLNVQELTLRASEQVTDQGTGGIKFQGLRVVFRGTMKQGQKMGASVTLELVYVLIEINGKVELELDKLNDKYIVNGVDILEEVRKYC